MADRMVFPSVAVFDDVKPDKAQALKVLEEAAEVFGAWQACELDVSKAFGMLALIDELADVIQAAANLAWAIGIEDMREPMARCEQRNRARGRITGDSWEKTEECDRQTCAITETEWIALGNGMSARYYACDNCGEYVSESDPSYCPHCGAKVVESAMREAE